jgi:hypothetical protein
MNLSMANGPSKVAGVSFNVTINNATRKTEWLTREYSEFHDCLTEIRRVFDIEGRITGVSWDGGDRYGVYLIGKPLECSIDLNGFETDPNGDHIMSLKLNVKDGSYSIKTYHGGNIKGVDLGPDKYIVGTGQYINEDRYTVYYVDPNIVKDASSLAISQVAGMGFSATTFYADGTTSDESVYTPVEYVPE